MIGLGERALARALLLPPFFICSTLLAQDFSSLDAAAGQALFERNWVAAPASTGAADGLGPYYTARSCAACHPGGGGSADVAALNFVIDDPVYGQLLQPRAVTGMAAEARVTVAWNPIGRETLADGTVIPLHAPAVTTSEWRYGIASQTVVVRRAPALAGLAMLEQVPLEFLQALADPDDRNADGISGRLPPGRFGWTARTPTLREQVARALSLDLGLSTSLFPAPAGDCTAQQVDCLREVPATGDLLEAPDTVLNLLLSYLHTLPLPTPPLPDSAGATVFTELGCSACHVPELHSAGQELRAYTDLLLHDMGPTLAERGGPPPLVAEWRTAPLWGLGQNTRFLHDGRAESLTEAILWHGGEGKGAREAYRRLNADQRAVLHQWLLGL